MTNERVFLPREVILGLEAARRRNRQITGGKLRVQMGDDWYPIRSFTERGFDVAMEHAPKLRGLVEIYDGPRMIRSALIVASHPKGDMMHYVYKRATVVQDGPAVDYVRADDAPVAYIGKA